MTKAEARKVVRWFQKRMGIQDWTVYLWIQDIPPDWARETFDENGSQFGVVQTRIQYKQADIAIVPSRVGLGGTTVLCALFHELQHVLWRDVRGVEDVTLQEEGAVQRMAAICETAYLAEMKGKRKRIL